jgi:hypothetical protein
MSTFGPGTATKRQTKSNHCDETTLALKTMGDDGTDASAAAPPPQDELQLEDSNNNLAELQETVSRISAHKGIESVVIWQNHHGRYGGGGNGDIVYSSQQPQGDSAKKAAAAQRLLQAAEDYFGSADETTATTTAATAGGAVSFVQVTSTSGRELMISPDQGFVLAVEKR